MQGHLALILHAHLPFVRHPEHETFLEENWLFEAISECYLPLVQLMEGWLRDGLDTRLTLTLSPTLCSMLLDPLLQSRYARHLELLIELAEKEIHRTHWDAACQPLARMYHQRFTSLRQSYQDCHQNLVTAFRRFQETGRLEIITTAATHAVLPLLAAHPPSLRAQILVARDHYRHCFGRAPRGFWLPECAYGEEVERPLAEAGIRWFVTDTHGILFARPRPRYGVFAPVFTPDGLAAFGRDMDSAAQVWSRHHGYPADPRYRDFYRDIGFDLDHDYIQAYQPAPGTRTFTGIKYHAISRKGGEKKIYDRNAALMAAADHAHHFMEARREQMSRLGHVMEREPLVVSPYDAELFGHWWYEGPEFLDCLVRRTAQEPRFARLTTPGEYLQAFPSLQVARPSPSSWGEDGYWKVWLNEATAWIYPHLDVAQQRMTDLARRFPNADGLTGRALRQAARELLLAQASDWPFILRTGTSPEYARQRLQTHLHHFLGLYQQLNGPGVDADWLGGIEAADNLFPDLDHRYWA